MDYKIQALNGFKLYFDQLSSIFREKNNSNGPVNYDELTQLTGLNRRKIRMLFTYLSDIGFNQKRTLKGTSLGNVIFRYDPYLETEATLWLMHFLSASNPYLLVWNRVFNKISDMDSVNRDDLIELFNDLRESVSDATFKEHLGKEIAVILDAYTNQRFSRLGLIETDDAGYRIVRNLDIPDQVMLASIIRFRDQYFAGATAIDVSPLCLGENSPGRIYSLDERVIRNKLERLKNHGFIALESRADLDQLRLSGDLTVERIMEEYYKGS